MTRSAEGSHANEDLPPAMRSLVRTFRLGYRAEPRLLALSLGLALLMMLPDALLALWLKFLVDGVLHHQRRAGDHCRRRSGGLGDSDLVPVVALATRPAPLPRSGLRSRSRATSLTSRHRCPPSSTTNVPSTSTAWRCCAIRCSPSTTCSCRCSRRSAGCSVWRSRCVLLGSIHPVLVLLMLFAMPDVLGVDVAAGGRASRRGVGDRRHPPGPAPLRARHHCAARQGGARHQHRRLASARDAAQRGSAGTHRSRRCAGPRRLWHTLGVGDVRRRVRRRRSCSSPSRPRRGVGDVVLVLAAGSRLLAVRRRRRSASSASCAASGSTRRGG